MKKQIRLILMTFMILSLGLIAGGCDILPIVGAGQGPLTDPTPVVNPPPVGGFTRGVAPIESVAVRVLESFPVQVEAVVSGYMPDSCTTIEGIVKERRDTLFAVSITTTRPADASCAQAVYPFQEIIALDVLGLNAGVYTVDVNGIRGQFELAVDNQPIAEGAILGGSVWHDQCAVAGGEGGVPVVATPGCVKNNEGLYEGNGLLDTGEPGISGVLVDLGLGACPSSGFATTVTGSDGAYRFADLEPGTYCVSITPIQGQNVAALIPGGWTFPTRNVDVGRNTITVVAGEEKQNLDFGWDYQFLPEPPQLPTPTVAPATPTPRPTPCDWASFVKDVNVTDGTVFTPGARFTKIWRLKNVGTCTWTKDYDLVYVSGDKMNAPGAVALPGSVRPGETVDVSVTLIAPEKEGDYRGYWSLRNAAGVLFGLGGDTKGRFWVDIEVEEVFRVPKYSFAESYCDASWRSAAGSLACPGSQDSEVGFVVKLDNPALENRREDEPTLWVHPNHANESWIQGTYPAFRVKDGDRFRAWVGCLEDSEACDVTFELGYLAENGKYRSLGAWREVYDGKVTIIDLDISALAGEDVRFVLTMSNDNGRPRRANGFWFSPNISRISRNLN
jgi:hypothetical protein